MPADRTMAELDELILALKVELTVCEDWHSDDGWTVRDKAIRDRIHELEAERDLLPGQRQS